MLAFPRSTGWEDSTKATLPNPSQSLCSSCSSRPARGPLLAMRIFWASGGPLSTTSTRRTVQSSSRTATKIRKLTTNTQKSGTTRACSIMWTCPRSGATASSCLKAKMAKAAQRQPLSSSRNGSTRCCHHPVRTLDSKKLTTCSSWLTMPPRATKQCRTLL